MTKGELFRRQFDVMPCEEGSFLVRVEDGLAGSRVLKTYAFSNLGDLLRWFQIHAGGTQPQAQPQQDLKSRLLEKHESRPLPLPVKPSVKRAFWPVKLT